VWLVNGRCGKRNRFLKSVGPVPKKDAGRFRLANCLWRNWSADLEKRGSGDPHYSRSGVVAEKLVERLGGPEKKVPLGLKPGFFRALIGTTEVVP
jgi:hypothetical protein